MRTANFKEFVLWPIAYKCGLDPAQNNFEDGEARAIGTYINACVRKVWSSALWPEWSVTSAFVPGDSPLIGPNVVPINLGRGFHPATVTMAKVIGVSLLDPRTTDMPIDIPFEQISEGIDVGPFHGQQVWIRYLPNSPVYTAEVWSATRTYGLYEVTYSPVTGECYKSIVAGNKNHDPSISGTPTFPPVPQTQEFIPGSSGFDAQTKIMSVKLARVSGVPVGDPPDAGLIFTIIVKNSAGATIATAAHTADGVESLADILQALVTTISSDPDLSTFTITEDDTLLTVTFEDASDFVASGTVGSIGPAQGHDLIAVQTKSYIPATAPTDLVPQETQIVLTNQFIYPGSTFTFTFVDLAGVEHIAIYTALVGDGTNNVLAGIAAAIQAQASTDTIMAQLHCTLDLVTSSLLVSSPMPGGVYLTVELPFMPSQEFHLTHAPWWVLEPFPFELIDPVLRNANADILKEWGQYQAGLAEEQGVPGEVAVRTTVTSDAQYKDIGARGGGKSRYAIR